MVEQDEHTYSQAHTLLSNVLLRRPILHSITHQTLLCSHLVLLSQIHSSLLFSKLYNSNNDSIHFRMTVISQLEEAKTEFRTSFVYARNDLK